MADTLIAQIGVLIEAKPARDRHRPARPRPTVKWHLIYIGKSRHVRCDCGGWITDLPKDFAQTMPIGACDHITALYGGNVSNNTCLAHRFRQPLLYRFKLTERGEAMFPHRWAAQKLLRDAHEAAAMLTKD